jgi:DNA-binding GntR family transcriptional regulator
VDDKPAPAAQRAYTATKDLILSGRIPGGSLLSEGEIADQLTLSRTPVREAFLRLEAEDLLRLIPKRGAVVLPVPATEAADLLDLRLALETGAVRRMAERTLALDELMAVLADSISRQNELVGADDVSGFAVADQQFHSAIVTAAGNAIAGKFYASLADRQRRMTIGAVGARPHRLPALVKEHRALMARVRARDVDGFQTTLARHLDATHNLFHGR